MNSIPNVCFNVQSCLSKSFYNTASGAYVLEDNSQSARVGRRLMVSVTELLLFLVMICMTVPTFSATEQEDKNPLGCRNSGYRFVLKTLDLVPHEEEGIPSMYFMFNQTNKPVQLSQMRTPDDSDVMNINHVIPPKQWAVLAMDHRFVKYACSVADGKSTYGQLLDCEQSLKVCNFARVKYGLNNRGNFWMVSGNSKNGALRDVTYYGVIAR